MGKDGTEPDHSVLKANGRHCSHYRGYYSVPFLSPIRKAQLLCFIFLWLFFDWQALVYGIGVSLSPHTALIFSAWSNQKVFPVRIFKFSYPLPQLSLPTQLCCLYAYVTIISVYYLFLFYFGAYVFSKDIVLKAWTPAYGDIERWWKL